MNYKFNINDPVFVLDENGQVFKKQFQVVAQCNLLGKAYYILNINIQTMIDPNIMLGGLYLYPEKLLLTVEESKFLYFNEKSDFENSQYDNLFDNPKITNIQFITKING